MSAKESTHIARSGPAGKRRRRFAPSSPAPVVRKVVQGVGRHADRHYDPVTGRKRGTA
jgi:hypothetical protein